LEERYLGGYGATATSEARVQVVRPLTIDTQFHTMVEFTGFELTFDRARDQPYLDMMLNPRAKRLANMVEQFIATTNFQTEVFQAYGSPGVPIDFNTVLQTDAYMTQLGIPEDGNRYWANPPAVSATLTNDLYTVFNMTVNRGALLDGFIGHLSGFDFFKTNFLQRQVAGTPGATGGTPPTGYVAAGVVTNGPITGGNTIVVSGLGAGVVFNVGDILTFDVAAGVFMVNPLTYEPLAQTAQFVVTAQVTSAGGSATIPVNPTIVISGARQNISAAIPNGAQMYLAGSHNVSMAFHNQAIVFAAPPIKELKGGVEAVTSYSDLYKMAMTYSLGADIRNYVQLDRIDIIAGVAINPEFAVVVMS
jgi:P22 coat protein - gene protein 5